MKAEQDYRVLPFKKNRKTSGKAADPEAVSVNNGCFDNIV